MEIIHCKDEKEFWPLLIAKFSGVVEFNNRIIFFKEGIKHREDGPAVESLNGYKEWRIDGVLHRLDGPAFEDINGHKEWWVSGLLHRIDGPAVESSDGRNHWWIDGKNYNSTILLRLREENLFLGKEKGKYDLYWLKFLTENQGIQEFPIIPGMDTYAKLSFVLKGFIR